MGAIAFEVATTVIPGSKAKHATKLKALDDLADARFAKVSEFRFRGHATILDKSPSVRSLQCDFSKTVKNCRMTRMALH